MIDGGAERGQHRRSEPPRVSRQKSRRIPTRTRIRGKENDFLSISSSALLMRTSHTRKGQSSIDDAISRRKRGLAVMAGGATRGRRQGMREWSRDCGGALHGMQHVRHVLARAYSAPTVIAIWAIMG